MPSKNDSFFLSCFVNKSISKQKFVPIIGNQTLYTLDSHNCLHQLINF